MLNTTFEEKRWKDNIKHPNMTTGKILPEILLITITTIIKTLIKIIQKLGF